MDRWFACRSAGKILRAAVLAAATIVPALTAGAAAQTLAEPNPPSKSSVTVVPSKPRAAAQRKSCAQYGPGFAPMPGTGACIKIGGFVEGTVGFGR